MNDEYLLNRLRERHAQRDTTNFDVLDFVYTMGSGIDALMYSRLFLPEFLEVDGMVLRQPLNPANAFVASVREYAQREGDRGAVERSFNLLEVTQLLTPTQDDLDEAGYYELAEAIAVGWRARLAYCYPTRKFNVEIADPADYGGELVVTFSETR